MAGAAHNRGKSKQDYATPRDFRDAVSAKFGVPAWDLACSPENQFGPGGITKEQDSFSVDWHLLGGLLWLNPEFDDIAPWAKKSNDEQALGARELMLVPASVGSNWFKKYVHRQAPVLFLNGRLCFDGVAPYPKDCMLILWGFEQFVTPLSNRFYDVWTWK